jgi:DNA helicase-2/ATP-dependent DNA helicase PcrA
MISSMTKMEVIADLHIHSHFSIATGRDADLEHLDLWGRYKGVQVVGTGDCTHPRWLADLAAKLEPAAAGVYALKPGLALPLNLTGPPWEAVAPVRFVITGEVSTIYKKGGKVRKVHLLLVLPDLAAAQQLSQRLGRLGNVASDGRPILGLDAQFVLELVLEIDPRSLVIPAHIWTPWFSVLGSKSGFDSLEECFEASTAHIYAVETGLSSDPPMNWRVSDLDRFLLVSNSDAHSPQKLGREANIFQVDPVYPELARALRTREGFGGTIEFFPQEGKYHLDGHRHCGLRLEPAEAKRLGGLCPQCGKPLTLGVMHRVLELADRGDGVPPAAARPFESLITLPAILAEVLGVNPGSKKVRQAYFRLLDRLGPELEILRRAPLTEVAREGGILLAHGLDRMRRGEVHIAGGYDGAYGEIRLFTPAERTELLGQGAFFSHPAPPPQPPGISAPDRSAAAPVPARPLAARAAAPAADPLLAGLNAAQKETVVHQGPPLIVQAGPGTGKTRALTHRLAYLISRRGVDPEAILALTFTRQAAAEMAERIGRLLGDRPGLERLTLKTFHALGQQMLQDHGDPGRAVADEEQRRHLLRETARAHHLPWGPLERQITRWKQALTYPEDLAAPTPGRAVGGGDGARPAPHPEETRPYLAAFAAYEAALSRANLWDYEDLIARPALLLTRHPEIREAYRTRFRHLLVDEYQDLNEAQYRLFRQLAGPRAEIMVIGDPDQAIYGFRGARPEYFGRFREDWPEARVCRFDETYRLPAPILKAAAPLRSSSAIGGSGEEGDLELRITHQAGDQPLVLLTAATPGAEARVIAREIEKLVGGLSHYSLEDAQVRHQAPEEKAGFRDVAVLYRLHALGPELERGLTEAGIPCQQAKEGVGPDWDGLDLAAERVKLLTLHAAKGLEFPYVFIAGCETGLMPWEPGPDGAADLEEERRLFYVGLTRASRQVFLTRSRERTVWGQRRRPQLSPWVRAIPPEVLAHPEPPASRTRPARQPGLFPEIAPPRGKRSR